MDNYFWAYQNRKLVTIMGRREYYKAQLLKKIPLRSVTALIQFMAQLPFWQHVYWTNVLSLSTENPNTIQRQVTIPVTSSNLNAN